MVLKTEVEWLINYYRSPKSKITFAYLLPLLGFKWTDIIINKYGTPVQTTKDSNFINCYIGDEKYPEITKDNKVLLLYKFDGNIEFVQFEGQMKAHARCIDIYDPYMCFVMFIFKVQDKFIDDYELVLQGKYSEISSHAKNTVIEFHGLKTYGDQSRTYQILHKMEQAFVAKEEELNEGLPSSSWIKIPRDQEAQSIIDEDLEIFKYVEKELVMVPNKSAE